MKTLIAVCGSVFLVGCIILGLYISANNREVSLRNQFKAQQKSNESSFDKTWKVIQQQAGVAVEERETFRKTYVEIMDSTQGVAGNGQLASFFTQAQVNISPDLFAKLMTTIEAQREGFHRDQQKLLEIVKQHDNVLTMFPSSFFVGSREPLEARIVTSSKTDQTFITGQDNDVDLFKK